jgi:hypothetical protein
MIALYFHRAVVAAAWILMAAHSAVAQPTATVYAVTPSNRLLGEPPTPPVGRVFALTSANELVAFNPDTPGTVLGPAPIANLASGERVVGIDFRPANNLLYGLGSSGQLYLIDTSTASRRRCRARSSASTSTRPSIASASSAMPART